MSDVTTEVEAAANDWMQAWVRGDAGALERSLAPDYALYLGRVDSQPNSAQFKAALDAQSKTITDANAATLMAECVAAVKTKVQLLQSIATPSAKAPANPQGR